MRHVRNAEGFVAFHRSVNDIDGVAAQHQVDERSAGALPALDLVLAHGVDKIVLLARTELPELAAAVNRLARIVDGANRTSIKAVKGWANIEDACFEQCFFRRNGELLVDEMGNACATRAGNEGLTQRLDSFRLVGLEQPEWHVLRMCFARGQEYLDTSHRTRKYPIRLPLNETPALSHLHSFPPNPTPTTA